MTSPALKFDADSHRYTLEGVPGDLTSVTTALKGAGLIEYDKLLIPAHVLENARQRGKAVHAACHYLDEGDLDWGSVDPAIEGYIQGWQKFKEESGVVFESMEMPLFHPIYKYAGTPDRTGIRQGRRGVYDIKTYECDDWTGLQLAGYEMMARPQGELPWERWGVWLKADGKYRMKPFTDRNDGNTFLSCLAVTNWKKNHGGLK